ncbi:MAG TPA: DapH/DapD/GlmU-related protein [Armatimonadota bacterium]
MKDLIRHLQQRARHPGARLALGSRVSRSSLGRDVRVEAGAGVVDSHLGDRVSVASRCSLVKCSLGDYSYVAPETLMREVSTGRFCSIGPRCLVGSAAHPITFVSTSPAFYTVTPPMGGSFADREHFGGAQPVVLGHDVWVGAHVLVRDGVKVGTGAVLAAGAVVVKDVPPYSVVGGVPARLIRMRFAEDRVERLLETRWWEWSTDRLKAAQSFLASEDVDVFLQWAGDQTGKGNRERG